MALAPALVLSGFRKELDCRNVNSETIHKKVYEQK